MIALRIRGQSYKNIATEFNVSEDTVERTLNYAKRAGLVAQFEDQILEELVPAAIENFKTAMQNGDTQVALEVFKGTGLLLRPQERAKPAIADSDGDEDLEVYIRRIRGGTPGHSLTEPAAAAPALDPRNLPTVAALAIEAPQAALQPPGREDRVPLDAELVPDDHAADGR